MLGGDRRPPSVGEQLALRPLVDGKDFPCHALNRDRISPCAELAWEVSPMCASIFTESLSLTPIAEFTRPSRDIVLVITPQHFDRFDSLLAGRPTFFVTMKYESST